jgi:tetratricopeptide (TPR) repeat protein
MFATLARPFPLFGIVNPMTRGLSVNFRTVAALLALFGSGSVWAQQNPGPPGGPAIPMPAGPLAGTAPAAPPSSQQTGPVGAPSMKGPSPELRAAYDEAFKLSMQNPSDPPTLAKFAELAIQVGDIEGAISALERLLLIDGDQADVKLELGVLYYRLGSLEAARMYLESARSSKRASAEVKDRVDTFLKAMPKK